ncbi:polysaccharide pyruvyl transferase family protein [Chryseobacterium flavum]|uniref:polysaccharide pyruvyl transferase family protein n=1 Tax=Chryseobacterium flavum TaxID=415851 RepID=UPI0028AC5B98|nr:polysaccharide pyruvyl transferase family protein [Chryseobacterium flavum]
MSINIGIRGGYGLYNFGDDALLVALYQNFLANNISEEDIYLLCVKSNYLNKQLKNPKVIDYNQLDSSIEIQHLIYGGGTQFYSFDTDNRKKIKDILIKNPLFIFSKIRNQIILLLRKRFIENKFEIADYAKKIYLLGVGVGPFSKINHTIESKTANLFKKASFISIRDTFSSEKCKEWGVKEYMHSPDLCYSMDVSSYFNESSSLKKVGVVVRDWNHTGSQDYYDKLIRFVEKLRNEKYEVTFISLDKRSDVFWTKYFVENKENFIQWDADRMTFDEFYGLFSQFDLHITARFHGAVFASMFHIPFITIEVEQKLKMIAENYEGGAYCWKNDFDLEKIMNLVKKVESDYLQHKKVIINNTAQYKEIVQEQYKELIKKICKN